MPLDGPGCGVRNHPSDCLCDVVVVEPVEIMENWTSDSFMIRPLLERMGESAWTREGLLDLLTKQVDIHDDLVAFTSDTQSLERAKMYDRSDISNGRRHTIREMSDAGIRPRQIRQHLLERYGVDASERQVHSVIDAHRKLKRRRFK